MQVLEEHFDAAFDAPDGIKKLRELILTLAMQGKLVEQDPDDQPASELLKEIEAEKRRLVVAGKIKAPKPLPPIEADEVPYEVPVGWEWVRLGTLALSSDSGWSPQCAPEARVGEEWGVLKVSAVSWGKFLPKENKALLHGMVSRPETEIRVGDFLISRANTEDLVARSVIVFEAPAHLMMSDKIVRLNLCSLIEKRYINVCNGGSYARHHYISNASGTSSSMKNVSREVMSNLLIPLPPLAEQRRIVARIDELMARCDELEVLRASREQKRLDTHTAALNALLSAKASDAFAEAWQFVAEHFGELHSAPKNVAELRKAVLQLAVMGKLVPQDPSDPPARELLKEIEQERNRLIVAGKIRAPRPLPPVTEEEQPYQVPEGWEWVRLADLFAVITDGDHQPPPQVENGIPFLVIGNVNNGFVSLKNCRYVEKEYYDQLDWIKKPVKNDILYTVTGSYGITIPVHSDEEFCVQRHIAILKALNATPSKYVIRFLGSRYAFEYATSIATGIAQKTVPLSGLRSMSFPLPPLPEQHRIVAKIDQFMALCDQLEVGLAAQTGKQTELLNAVMAAVTPASTTPTRRAAPARAQAAWADPEASEAAELKRRSRPAKVQAEVEPAGEVPGRGRGRPRKETIESIGTEGEAVPVRRGPGRPRKNAAGPVFSIPTATSEADAMRRIEALKIERARGERQVGLFGGNNE
jgi:type I restriction enzyme, S subunit